MHDKKKVLIISMPFAETSIPSIQLSLLSTYLKKKKIDVSAYHLYLAAADFYGLNNYNNLINSPNDSYIAQMVFSKYIFPDHWEKNNNNFRNFYNNIILNGFSDDKLFTFEYYVKQSDRFYDWAINNIDWEKFDIIGFTLNYGQLLPSLAISKKIKEKYPDKIIVFGGSSTVDDLGVRFLETFDWIDFIISGDGEYPLYLLSIDCNMYKSIPGLIYRKGKNVYYNKNDSKIDISSLPFLDFSSYYDFLNSSSNEIKQYFSLNGRLPIELSRGCWWNKCTFCNIGLYHNRYREKDIDRFVEELDFLSENYKILNFQIIGTTLPKTNNKILCEKIISLGKDFSFYAEARAKSLKKEDYILLKQAGFSNIQTGIETFSQNYLKKICKGVKIIDNIAALKFCKENDIDNSYNFIIDYPNEEELDFKQTQKNISLFKSYLDPPQISKFVVGFGSPIFNNHDKFNIQNFEYKKIDKIMYPKSILEKDICFFYSFKRVKKININNWEELIKKWHEERQKNEITAIKSKKIIDHLILYFLDGGSFVKIYDKRDGCNVKIYILNDLERLVFLSCLDVTNLKNLCNKLSKIPEFKISAILNSFVKIGIIFKEEDYYLSLPLNYYQYNKTYTELERLKISTVEEPITI